MTENNSKCAFCESKRSNIKYPTTDIFSNHYTINQCEDCHAYFLAPRPDEERLQQAYDVSYYGEKEEKFEGIYEKVINYFRDLRARKISRFIPKEANILDIGCGNGNFLMSFRKFGNYSLFGIEREGNSATRALRHTEINLTIGSLENSQFEKNTFDLITLIHVFEHLTEPRKTMDIINKIIKPGGILVMSFPNIASWQSKMFKGNWLHLDAPRHLFFFDPKAFADLMKKNGFTIIQSSYASTEQNPFGMVQSLLNCILKKKDVLFERLKGNTNYASEYGKISVFFQKLFFICLFPFFTITDLIFSPFRINATVKFILRKN